MSFRADGSYRYDDVAWRRVRQVVLERDGYMCQVRGEGCDVAARVVDHIVPIRAGGALFDEANLRASCQTCNSSRVWREPQRRPSREW